MIDSNFWKGKKVFLTGHTGFKGSWLSIWLKELGSEVMGYSLEPNTTPSLFELAEIDKIVQSIIGDIRDLDLLKSSMASFKPDIVIHMAAHALVRDSYKDPVDTYSINVMGTVNLLESVRHCPSVKAVVNVTTDKVYENREWVWGYRETDSLSGYDPYSNSKACSELVTSSYLNSFFNPLEYARHGVAIATARAGNVIGGGDWAKDRLIPDIFRAIENNTNISIRNPDSVRPWQHVLEPLSGYLMLAEKLYIEGVRWNGAWNFGPIGQTYSVKKILSVIQELSTIDLKIDYTLQSKHETKYLSLDSSKARRVLLWNPALTIDGALKFVVEWYRSYQSKIPYELCLKQIKKYQSME